MLLLDLLAVAASLTSVGVAYATYRKVAAFQAAVTADVRAVKESVDLKFVQARRVDRPAAPAPAVGRQATFKRKRERWTDASKRPAK